MITTPRRICRLLLFALLTIQVHPATADRKEELSQLRQRIDKLQRDLAKSEESRGEAADALRISEKAISEVNRTLVSLTREQQQISHSLADLATRMTANQADTARQQELLERMIRHQYMHGNADAMRLMLEGKDVSEVERQMHYFGYVSKSRALLVSGLRQNMVALAEIETATRQKQHELVANADDQRNARLALQAERQARQKTFSSIKAEIAKGRREIGRLKRDEDRLARLVDQLAKAIARSREERKAGKGPESTPRKGEAVDSVADSSFAGKAFQALKGKLKLPARGELLSRFGSQREEGLTWKGLFIRAESGHSVHAVADGQVVFADWLRGYGNLLILDHGNGYMSLYGNNESLLKQVGEMAQGGERIASVGSSGGALESGVYFEMRHEGKPFDPMKWVTK